MGHFRARIDHLFPEDPFRLGAGGPVVDFSGTHVGIRGRSTGAVEKGNRRGLPNVVTTVVFVIVVVAAVVIVVIVTASFEIDVFRF